MISQRPLQYWIDNGEKHLAGDNTRGSGDSDKFLIGDYDSFFSLVSHPTSTPDKVILIMTVSAVVILHHLRRSGYLSDGDDQLLLARVIVHCLCIMRYNTHAVIETLLTNPERPIFTDVR